LKKIASREKPDAQSGPVVGTALQGGDLARQFEVRKNVGTRIAFGNGIATGNAGWRQDTRFAAITE